ncbi:hypothetical protein ACFRCW_46470 [Streptomyces sp. NPDC056653]|uniref:effector-associated constant component EACC1 n=1 Tax=Streptomyces sp. NPDC056653 TaxID=3345894 RepID=UPI0036AA3686
MEEVVLRLEKLLFPAIADVAVLPVNADIEILRVEPRAIGFACESDNLRRMELALKVDEAVGGESEALLRWLHEEQNLRGQARMFMGGVQAPGSMGGALDVVNVVLSNSLALGSLLTTLAAWRSSRPSPQPSVRIEVNGVPVTVNSDDPEVIRSLIETLRGAAPDADLGSDDPGTAPASDS